MAKKIFVLGFILLWCAVIPASAQEYHGTTGLLQVPSAEMDSAGTFRGGFSWMDRSVLPDLTFYGDHIPFDAPCYTVGISAFRWIQLSFTETLVKIHPNDDTSRPLGYYNLDRHINIKLNPLYEGRWWPAVAIGWDDVGSLKSLKIEKSLTANNFFENMYVACSKHFDIKGYEIGVHLAYRYYPSDSNKERRGFAGGLTFVPRLGASLQGPRAWLQRPRLIVEWDGVGVNVGADVLLWRHLFVQVCLAHGSGFMGGLGYHYRIKY